MNGILALRLGPPCALLSRQAIFVNGGLPRPRRQAFADAPAPHFTGPRAIAHQGPAGRSPVLPDGLT
jgi:hypothetical protein